MIFDWGTTALVPYFLLGVVAFEELGYLGGICTAAIRTRTL
jgi:hypothetical protein